MAIAKVWHECPLELGVNELPAHSRELFLSTDHPLRFNGKWLVTVAGEDFEGAIPVRFCRSCGLYLEKAYLEGHISIKTSYGEDLDGEG